MLIWAIISSILHKFKFANLIRIQGYLKSIEYSARFCYRYNMHDLALIKYCSWRLINKFCWRRINTYKKINILANLRCNADRFDVRENQQIKLTITIIYKQPTKSTLVLVCTSTPSINIGFNLDFCSLSNSIQFDDVI